MTQDNMIVVNAPGATVRGKINTALQALASNSKGPSAPATPYAGQHWLEDDNPSSTVWTLWEYDGADWIKLGEIDTTNNKFNVMTNQSADVASASTINLDTAYGLITDVTGTTTITAVTLGQGRIRFVRFTGALTLTHGSNLVLPGGANITTAAGDFAILAGYASSVVRCVSFVKASAAPVLMSPITNSLAGNVSLNNTGNFFDGPSVAQGTSGTWHASGTVTVGNTAAAGDFIVKLWDGTTTIATAYLNNSQTNKYTPVSLSGYIANPAGNLRISVRDQSGTSGLIAANVSGAGKDSTITAIRIG